MGNTKTKPRGQVQVDGIEIQHHANLQQTNLRSPYRPNTADAKKKKKNTITPLVLDEAKIGILNSWVSKHIKKKECVVFIPQESSEGETCRCGYSKNSHFTCTPDVPPETKWDPQIHLKEFPSDAHGDMTFTGTTRNLAKYVRASNDTRPSVLFELMTEQWGLSVPNLLISVTGGAKNFNISPRLKNQFSRGLVKAAQSTGAWIITGGSHAGVMKHVGEAIRDFSGGDQDSETVLIGIATWGIVHNRKSLISEAGGAPALYTMDEGSQGALCCLDNNHTHFILVDDGTHGRYGVEIPLRTRLEKFISEQTMHRGETTIKIPIVCVVLEGGPGTLDTIYNSMCNNTPCVIVEGSGRVADIIAQVANLSSSRITINLIKEKLQNLFSDTYDSFTEAQIIMWTKKIQDIVRMGCLLTILREEKVGDQGMDVAILQALLKASHSADYNGQENWDHQLKLAVSWNRADIAETQIFTEDWTWMPSDLYPCLTLSLIEDKPSFVRLFLERGVSLADYLTWDTLTYLYNNTDPSSLVHSKLERYLRIEGSKEVVVSTIELYHVSRVLQELLGDLTEPLYPEAKHKRMGNIAHINIKINGKVGAIKKKYKHYKQLEHPVRDLLIWCIVQNRAKLADIIWKLMFLTKTWWGKLSVDNGFIQILLCMLLFPLIFSSTNSSSFLDGNTNERRNRSVHQDPRNAPRGCHWMLRAFFTAPIVKFYYNLVSYIGFLWLFAYVLMIDFQTYPSWREYLLYVWVFSIFTEELRQLLYDPEHRGFVKKSAEYIPEFWNQVDLMALGLFIVGLIWRLVWTDTVYLGRVFLSLDFMIFCTRLMHIFSVSKVLGPKIIILRRMVKDIFFFLFLLAIWIISYGVAKQAILTTNEERLDWIFRNVVYGPYLTLFGQIPSEVDSLNFDPTKCSQNGTDPTLPKCVFNDGSKALFPEWLTIILMCLYHLLANILLLNLLIVMFSYTFGEVESHTDQVWKFHRFGLIKEYNERPAATPPFILLAHLYNFLKHGIFRHPAHGHKVLRRDLDEGQESSLLAWESYMKDNYQQMQQQRDEHSQENLVKETADSVSAVLRLLKMEKGSEGHQLEERLSVLEEQMAQSTQYLNWIISALMEKGFSSRTRILVHSSSQDSEDKASDGSGEKNCYTILYHVKSRVLHYPDYRMIRYPVPDEMVPWEVEFPEYNPPLYNAERNDRGTYDPNTEMEQKNRKYNSVDGLFDFRSCCGSYTVQDGLPLNPMGRTGLRGVGSLRWFGPNHSLHPVVTRWTTSSANGPNPKASKNMLEVLVVRRRENELWSLPGGTLDPGQRVPIEFQALLKKTYLREFLALLDSGTEVFHGYLDDPRNTDNAWIETQAINVHLGTKESLDTFLQNLKESDHEITLRWQLLDHKIPLYANEKEILQRTAEHLYALF
uniref:Transient receptor potential cation channel subfamily M member 2 n=1 Tax=Pyxicephalus adspersus TaxID=30357 RepID=A0AAV3AY73_PYXAD|nr:TPA: hypothetical protein GDO54_000138 [Pyxicephalus adspersus]